MKGIIGKNKQQKLQETIRLFDGTITFDKYITSDWLNYFFIGIGPSLSGKIPSQSIKPKQYLENKLMKSIFLALVTSHWGQPHDGCSCNHRQHGRGEESAAKCFRFVSLV